MAWHDMAVCIRDVMLTQLSLLRSSSNVSCRAGHAVQCGIMTRTDRLFMSISHTSSSYNRGSCRHGQRCVSPCRNRGEVCVREIKRAWRLGSNFRGFSSGGSRVKSKSVRLSLRVKNTHFEFIILIIQNSTHTIISIPMHLPIIQKTEIFTKIRGSFLIFKAKLS